MALLFLSPDNFFIDIGLKYDLCCIYVSSSNTASSPFDKNRLILSLAATSAHGTRHGARCCHRDHIQFLT